MNDLDKLKELAGVEKLDEGTIGTMTGIEPTVSYREQTDMDKWMAIVNENELEETETKQDLNEHVVGDLQNGYGKHHKTTKFHSDYFPTGADANVVDHAGPASAKQGDNPMQKAIKDNVADDLNESKEIHKELVYEYRTFKSEK